MNKKILNLWLDRIWVLVLYLLGVAAWGEFFSWGNFPMNFHDWTEIAGPRLAFVQDAVRKGVLPLHMPEKMALRNLTDRFLSVPDLTLSPQVLLLSVMSVGTFVLVNVILLYSVGFWGLLWIRRRFSLSPIPFTILFLLYNFNGTLQAHMSVGHSIWAGSFLYIWFVILIFRLLDGQKNWVWVTEMAGLLLLIFLQGAYHQFAWALLFLGLLAIFSWKHFLPLLKSAVFAVLLSAVRIIPAVLSTQKIDTAFQGGYPTLYDLWQALVTIRLPGELINNPAALRHDLGYWELDLYVGLTGALFLVIFGLVAWWKNRRSAGSYWELAFPIAGITIFSIGYVYQIVRLIPFPLLYGERVSSRMVLLPLVFLIVIGVRELQQWLDCRKNSRTSLAAVGIGAVLLMANDLYQHLRVWGVSQAFLRFDKDPFDLSRWYVANYEDALYFDLLKLGAGISLAAAVLLFFLIIWERQRKQS